MAKLTRDDVLKLARLSKLELNEEEIKSFSKEIAEILSYVEQLKSVDIQGLEPTYQVNGLKNITRPDLVKTYQATPTDLLKNVPASEKNQIKVKRVLV